MSQDMTLPQSNVRMTIEFRHPSSGSVVPYEETTPWLRVDGVERLVDGWNACEFSLPPGKHRFEVGVPDQNFHALGRIERMVKLHPGESVRLIYQAPDSPGSIGELLFPDQVNSSGSRLIEALLGLVVSAVVICLVILLLW